MVKQVDWFDVVVKAVKEARKPIPTGKHYYKEITIILQHTSLQVIQERERELYRAVLQHESSDDEFADTLYYFKPGIERYTSGGVVIR